MQEQYALGKQVGPAERGIELVEVIRLEPVEPVAAEHRNDPALDLRPVDLVHRGLLGRPRGGRSSILHFLSSVWA